MPFLGTSGLLTLTKYGSALSALCSKMNSVSRGQPENDSNALMTARLPTAQSILGIRLGHNRLGLGYGTRVDVLFIEGLAVREGTGLICSWWGY